MIIVMRRGHSAEELQNIRERMESQGFELHLSEGIEKTIIGLIGDTARIAEMPLAALPGVETVMRVSKPYKVVSREFHPEDRIVRCGDVQIGGGELHFMAGPCSVEDRDQMLFLAERLRASGVRILRGGAYKPRTSPYAFQGLEEQGLDLLREAADAQGMLVVTELMDPRDLPLFEEKTDIIQIGARNMQNFRLLKEVGRSSKPILLKRGMSATIKEFLMSAEYIAAGGNTDIILCERGIRTFEDATRNTLDISAVPVLKELSSLPVIVDPSHGTGIARMVPPMAKASIGAGTDGLMIEVHQNPAEARSDGDQSLTPEQFDQLVGELAPFARAAGKRIST